MLEKIKALAEEAVAVQNKGRMEAALREISDLCATGGAMDAEQFEAAEKAQHEAGKTHSITGGFGMARIKKEGAAAHPDDIEGDMTPEQEAKQLAAYERDTGDVTVAAKKAPAAKKVAKK